MELLCQIFISTQVVMLLTLEVVLQKLAKYRAKTTWKEILIHLNIWIYALKGSTNAKIQFIRLFLTNIL